MKPPDTGSATSPLGPLIRAGTTSGPQPDAVSQDGFADSETL